MASIKKKPNSKFWHCDLYLRDGSRTTRSTRVKDAKYAETICQVMQAQERTPKK